MIEARIPFTTGKHMNLNGLSETTRGMKRKWASILILLSLVAANASYAGTFSGTTTVNQVIPDGGGALNPLASTMNVTVSGFQLSDITVTLNVSGGFNGDLSATLTDPNGNVIHLLNRVGVTAGQPFGFNNNGFTITLHDAASGGNIHYNGGTYDPTGPNPVTGNFQADGHEISESSSGAAFDSATAATLLGTFGGHDPNGTWTLVFSDWSGSGDPSTLVSWSLDLTAVPEPINIALAVFALVGIGVKVLSWRSKSKVKTS